MPSMCAQRWLHWAGEPAQQQTEHSGGCCAPSRSAEPPRSSLPSSMLSSVRWPAVVRHHSAQSIVPPAIQGIVRMLMRRHEPSKPTSSKRSRGVATRNESRHTGARQRSCRAPNEAVPSRCAALWFGVRCIVARARHGCWLQPSPGRRVRLHCSTSDDPAAGPIGTAQRREEWEARRRAHAVDGGHTQWCAEANRSARFRARSMLLLLCLLRSAATAARGCWSGSEARLGAGVWRIELHVMV